MKSCLVFILLAISAVFAGNSDLSEFIFHHIGNGNSWHPIPGLPVIELPHNIHIFGIHIGITLQVLMLFIASILMVILLKYASNRINLLPTGVLGHLVEVIVIYIRNEVVIPNIGKKEADDWLPFFLTLFMFILFLNLLGMIPGMSTVTSNINFTVVISLVILFAMLGAGMFNNGFFRFFKNLVPHGIPFFVVIILTPIEVVGLFTKVFALAIRLFANMTAGHIVIISLLALISILETWLVVPVSLAFSLFISLIEVLVCFLQAYIFTLLSALFIGTCIHQEH